MLSGEKRAKGARKRVVGLLIAGGLIAAVPTTSAVTGCTTHQCDTDCVVLGYTTGSNPGCSNPMSSAEWGDFTVVTSATGSTLTWETAPLLGGTWLDLTGQRAYILFWPPEVADFINSSCPAGSLNPADGSPPCGFAGAAASPSAIIQIVPYLSTGQTQDEQGWNSTVNAAGQVAQWGGLNPYAMEISNGTCAEYYLRVVVTVTIPSTSAPSPDAGTEPAADASTD